MLETETNEIVGSLQALGVRLRVLGSLGVSLRCPSAAELVPAFERTYADIDFAGYRREANAVSGQLGALGYVADREVTLTSEGRRGLYDHPAKGIHVDVFFDLLDFCHRIPLEGRLDQDRLTLPLAELLLSKLQIVRINEKDVIDIILLLLDHDLGEGDEVIDVGRVARLCAADWGLWRTTTGNLGKVSALALTYRQLDDERRSRVTSQVDALLARLESEPKTLAWRARARIGERVQWWTDVEEVR
jgi:hypothetical protein